MRGRKMKLWLVQESYDRGDIYDWVPKFVATTEKKALAYVHEERNGHLIEENTFVGSEFDIEEIETDVELKDNE